MKVPTEQPLPGTILIRGLAARCIIGVRPWERKRRQPILIDLELDADLGPAARSDHIEQALDYKTVKDSVLAHVEASRFNLLETLADSIARLALADSRVSRCRVTVDKPGALRHAKSVAIRLERSR